MFFCFLSDCDSCNFCDGHQENKYGHLSAKCTCHINSTRASKRHFKSLWTWWWVRMCSSNSSRDVFQHVFVSFLSRDTTYKILMSVCPHLVVSCLVNSQFSYLLLYLVMILYDWMLCYTGEESRLQSDSSTESEASPGHSETSQTSLLSLCLRVCLWILYLHIITTAVMFFCRISQRISRIWTLRSDRHIITQTTAALQTHQNLQSLTKVHVRIWRCSGVTLLLFFYSRHLNFCLNIHRIPQTLRSVETERWTGFSATAKW